MTEMIPPYLDDGEPVFIRLGRQSKAPAKGNYPDDGPFFRITDRALTKHVNAGGNVGRTFHDDLVGIDVDDNQLVQLLEEFPETLVIESGGSGFGRHYYYRVPDWNPSKNQVQLSDGGTDVGSIRTRTAYCLVPPSIHDETGDRYSVLNPREVADVSVSRLSEIINEFGSASASTGGGGGGGGSAGCSSIPELPSQYPDRPTDWNQMKAWLSSNGFLKWFNKTTSNDWSGIEWTIAKCLAEGGFSESSIFNALSRLHRNAKWHNRGSDYRSRTVRKAIVAACEDPYVEFSHTGDMEAEASESRKMEESGEGRTLVGGDKMTDFTETESSLAKESNAEGSTAVKAVKVEGKDGQDEFSFVSLRKGSLRERETADGDTALVVDIDDTQGSSIGTPEDLDVVIDALEQLKDELE